MVDDLSRPKVLDEMFQALVESKLLEPTFVDRLPGGACRRSPNRSAAIPR